MPQLSDVMGLRRAEVWGWGWGQGVGGGIGRAVGGGVDGAAGVEDSWVVGGLALCWVRGGVWGAVGGGGGGGVARVGDCDGAGEGAVDAAVGRGAGIALEKALSEEMVVAVSIPE